MAYYNSLDTNTVKGHLLVSTIGGGTSNSEYEFLTGNSIAFVPGTVPYQQFVLKDTFSLARLFKDRGYTTLALHPYDGSGYNRERVYSYFGFDYFYDMDSFTDPELVRNRYISDTVSYTHLSQEASEPPIPTASRICESPAQPVLSAAPIHHGTDC